MIRFLGHKQQALPVIRRRVSAIGGVETAADLFCGTAAISREFRSMGIQVNANDTLLQCVELAKAQLLFDREPTFNALFGSEPALRHVPLATIFDSPYNRVIALLNSLPGTEGFFYRNYSPGGTQTLETPRQYFTDYNARKVDSMRTTLREWHLSGLIDDKESALLLTDLMRAVNQVANIAGTYGYFLRNWNEAALSPIQLQRSPFTGGRLDHVVTRGDANELARGLVVDLAYLDPPYTKRQYSAYYHILETIAAEDEPLITGKSGLREWMSLASDYCYRRRAGKALEDLVDHIDAKYIMMSYNEDGHLSHDEIVSTLSKRGEPQFEEYDTLRYKSNAKNLREKLLKERLYWLAVKR